MKYLLVLLILISNTNDISKRIHSDRALVVPGKGANSIIINESAAIITKRLNTGLKIINQKKPLLLFKHIFKIKPPFDIEFNSLAYYKNDTIIIFQNNKVISIIIFNSKRITTDMVELQKGIDSVLFHYGNSNMIKIVNGSHSLYIYKKMGIAFFDDKSDNTIDMTMVFEPLK